MHSAVPCSGDHAVVPGLAAVDVRILEVDLFLEQERQIAALVQVESGGEVGPCAVIHPNAWDVVAVGDELAGLPADDGRVAAIDAHTAKAAEEQVAHRLRFHHQQCQAVLPQVAPAAAAAAIVMVGEERISEQPAEGRLDRDPLHPAVEACIRAAEAEARDLRLPVRPRAVEPGSEVRCAAVSTDQFFDRFTAGPIHHDCEDQDVRTGFTRRQDDLSEAQAAHRLIAVHGRPCRHPDARWADHCLWPVQGAALTDEVLDRREETGWRRAIAFRAQNCIGHGVGSVSAFIEAQGGTRQHAVLHRADSVQQRRDMPVVAQVVGRAAEDRDRGGGSDGERLGRRCWST